MTKVFNVLFLCTGNSARSILAEAIINRDGAPHFRGYSAGSQPKGAVHPLALRVLKNFGYPTHGVTSKSWHVYAGPDSPGFRVHRLRQCRRRDVPSMAGSADDRPLGY